VNAALAAVGSDLLAYSAQLAVVVASALALAALLRLRAPFARLALAQGLLALAVVLPWLHVAVGRDTGAARARVEAVLAAGAEGGRDVPGALAAVALAGAVARLGLLARRLWRLRRCRRAARAWEPTTAVSGAWAATGLCTPVCVSEEIRVPAAFGARRPVVLVPPRFAALPAAAQRAVLCHELLHVRRRDWAQMLAEEIAGALLWFHPAAWWLRARIRLAREQVVDAQVVGLTHDRRAYLEALLGWARLSGPAPAPLFLTESHLKSRVDVLLREVEMPRRRARLVLAVCAGGAALAVTATSRAFPLKSARAWFAARAADDRVAGVAGASAATGAAKKAAPRKPTSKVDPVYPADAKEKRVEGSVVLDVSITAAGEVKDVKATKGPAELRQSAVDAVRQWKFEPAAHDTRATLTVRYVLDE
jgi:TonB family protein